MIYFLILIFITFIAAYFHGIHEGMIMTQDYDLMHNYAYPGVRGHDWFGWYHLISSGRNLAFIGIGAALVGTAIIAGVMPILKVIPGTVFICWELAEIGYAEARGGRMIYIHQEKPYEHVVFFDLIKWKARGRWVYGLHVFRIVAGISLFKIGGIL